METPVHIKIDSSENDEIQTTFLDNSQYMVSEDNDDSHDGDDGERSSGVLREQDRFLPIANVARLMKKSIPKTGKIAKDARECVQECVSEFVSFITSEASDRCHQEKRKTINGEDILFAMSSLGFDNYVEPLKAYLQKYREAMKGEKNLTVADPTPASSTSFIIQAEDLQNSILTEAGGNDGEAGDQVIYFSNNDNQGENNATETFTIG